MSIRALNWAWGQTPPSVNAKLVLLNLADQANDEDVCHPFRATVATKCSPLSEHQVKRAMAALREAGLIEVIGQRQGESSGRFSSNEYRLAVEQSGAPRTVVHSGAPRDEAPWGTQAHHGRGAPRCATVSNEPLSAEPSPTGSCDRGAAGRTTVEQAPIEGLAATSTRPRDLLWDVFDERLGPPENEGERSKRNRALKLIREALGIPGLASTTDEHAAELRRRLDAYQSRWPGIDLTEMGVANNWSTLARPEPADGLKEEFRGYW